MLVDYPILLPTRSNLLQDPFGQHYPLLVRGQLQSATSKLSGEDVQHKIFWQKLHSCCSQVGTAAPTQPTKLLGRSQLAGAFQGERILFHALCTVSCGEFCNCLQYQSINTIWSAVSMSHIRVEEYPWNSTCWCLSCAKECTTPDHRSPCM